MTREKCKDYGGHNSDGEPCGAWAGAGVEGEDTGKCKWHRGTSPDGESHEGNQWAAKHGAWSESFVTDFLREDEIARVENAADVLEQPEGAQALARQVAAIALEQFRRTGDDRFLRRYVQICKEFGITPPEEMDLNVEGEGTFDLVINRQVVGSGRD